MEVVEHLESKSATRVHPLLLGVLAAVAVGLSALVWLHPTLGYAKSGVLDGADLRSDIITILWICFAVFAAISTGMLMLASRFTHHRAVTNAAAYVVGIASLFPTLRIIDKFI